ncbi:MAG: primosomal protein N' [Magnetospiraceae bacterium]
MDSPPNSSSPPPRAVPVRVTRPVDGPFDYLPPEGETVRPGSLVEVPFGHGTVQGVVWDGKPATVHKSLKTIARVYPAPPLPAVSRKFLAWVAAYTLSPLGSVLRMALPVPGALDPPVPKQGVAAVAILPDFPMTAPRQRVLEIAATGVPMPAAELARLAGVSPGVVAGLVKVGALQVVPLPEVDPGAALDPDRAGVTLSPDQARVAEQLQGAVTDQRYSVSLLDGVPGSGKTEIYFEAIAEALRQGQQALVLVPEIALTAQWLDRFHRRFAAPPDVWHSEVSLAGRRRTWRRIATGAARVVVGARSALFLPFADLGLIVVDEEHETAFKQEDGVIYNARDMAVVRARIGALPVVLASATPSLETTMNAQQGRYKHHRVAARHGAARPPEVQLVDLRQTPPDRGQWISPPLRQAISETLESGQQAMLFLNRRGYAPLTLCGSCGHRLQCPTCTTWLVSHRTTGRLICHHCGFHIRQPEKCPSCGTAESLVACGPGVERIAEEAKDAFPEARVMIASSDTLTGPRALADLVDALETGRVNLVIGTQILAKGHHFPNLTLVGAVDGDIGLDGSDPRAAERSFQVLYQVAGRAGRADRPGQVLIQTYQPESAVMRALASGDRDGLMALIRDDREAGNMPPFGRLVGLVIAGAHEGAVDQTARNLSRAAPVLDGVMVFGPAPAPLALLRGRHRRRLLLQASLGIRVQPIVTAWLSRVKPEPGVKIQVDVDPYGFM